MHFHSSPLTAMFFVAQFTWAWYGLNPMTLRELVGKEKEWTELEIQVGVEVNRPCSATGRRGDDTGRIRGSAYTVNCHDFRPYLNR